MTTNNKPDPRNPHSNDPYKPKFRKATHGDAVRIVELLRTHCHKGKDGAAHYAAGWDDERVAREVAPYLSRKSVSSLRTEFIGPLPGSGAVHAASRAELEQRMERLEGVVYRVVKRIGANGVVEVEQFMQHMEGAGEPDPTAD